MFYGVIIESISNNKTIAMELGVIPMNLSAVRGARDLRVSLCDWIYAARRGAETMEAMETIEELRLFLPSVSSLDERCRHVGRTPLMLCAQKGWVGCVSELLLAGADATLRDEQGRDALMLSLIVRKVNCAKILAPKSSLRARDVDGRTAFSLSMIHAPHRVDAELLSLLWKPGVDRWRAADGKTACDWALDKEVPALSEWLDHKRSALEARILSRASSGCECMQNRVKKASALRM